MTPQELARRHGLGAIHHVAVVVRDMDAAVRTIAGSARSMGLVTEI